MPRTKLVMKLIQNDKKRRTTYRNRRHGLVQKVSQLSTLCGVDAFLVCAGPGPGTEAAVAVTTWPADRRAVEELVARYLETPPDKVAQCWTPATFLHDGLTKQQRKLLKVRQCQLDDVLTPWDRGLDELSVEGLDALYDELGDKLQAAHRRMAELSGLAGGGAIVPYAAAQQQHALAFPDNAGADLGLLDAPSSIGAAQDYYQYHHPRHGVLPQPIPMQVQQPPCHGGFQFPMQPPYLALRMAAPPPQFVLQSDYFTGATGIMDRLQHYPTNVVNAGAAGVLHDDSGQDDFVAGLFADPGQGFAAGAADQQGYHGDLLGHGFAAGGAWPPLNNNQMDAASLQLQNELAGLPSYCCYGGSSARWN